MYKRLRDWQLFLIVHGLFAGIALCPFLLGFALFSGIGLGHSYAFFDSYTVHNLLTGAAFINRLNMNGFPSFIPVGFSLNPFTYIFTALLPPFTDLHWFVFANVVLGGLFCALFLRRLNASREAAIAGSVAYLTGCWWLVVTGDYIPFMPMLPLAGLTVLLSREHPLRAAFWGSILCGYIWLGMNTQVSLMIFAAWGVGTIAFAVREYSQGLRATLRPLWVLFVNFFIGTVIGLPRFIPIVIFADQSWRAKGAALATAEGIQPLSFVTYVFPYVSFPGLNFGGELVQIYIGVFALVFFIVGVLVAIRQKSFLRSWVIAYAFIFVLAFANSPLADLIFSVPPFSLLRGAGRWSMIGSFAAAPIVAAGFDFLSRDTGDRMRKNCASIIGWFAAILATLFCFGQLLLVFGSDILVRIFRRYFAYLHESLHFTQPPSFYDAFVERRIQELAAHPPFLQPRALLPFLALLVFAIILRQRTWQKVKLRPMTLAILTVIATAITLVPYDKYLPRSSLAVPNEIATFLQHHPGTALGMFPNETASELFKDVRFSKQDGVEWTLSHLIPNTNLFYGVPVLDYFDTVAARRPTALASYVGATWSPAPDAYRLNAMKGTLDDKVREFIRRKDLLNLQGVRYVISSIPLTDPAFTKVLNTSVTEAKLPVMLYENTQVRPFAYFATGIVPVAEDETLALTKMTEGSWPHRLSLMECEPHCPLLSGTGSGDSNVTVDTPNTLTIETRSNDAQWLVVTVNKLPGWQAYLDDVPVETFYANGTYIGLPLPAGTHTVRLRFSVMTLIKQGMSDLL